MKVKTKVVRLHDLPGDIRLKKSIEKFTGLVNPFVEIVDFEKDSENTRQKRIEL